MKSGVNFFFFALLCVLCESLHENSFVIDPLPL